MSWKQKLVNTSLEAKFLRAKQTILMDKLSVPAITQPTGKILFLLMLNISCSKKQQVNWKQEKVRILVDWNQSCQFLNKNHNVRLECHLYQNSILVSCCHENNEMDGWSLEVFSKIFVYLGEWQLISFNTVAV